MLQMKSQVKMHKVRSTREASIPLELGYVTLLAQGFIYHLETHQISLFKLFFRELNPSPGPHKEVTWGELEKSARGRGWTARLGKEGLSKLGWETGRDT